MVILDCRGQQCPQPVVQVRRQMQAAPDTPLQVLVDDPAARDNVGRLASSRGYRVRVEPQESGFRLELAPGEKTAAAQPAAIAGPTVVFVTSDQMGSGDPKLGQILMKNFFFTLAENDVAPDLLLFVNAGARLTVGGSDVIEPLQRLVDLGADIATCGLCLEFFGLKDTLVVGRVTNMLEIATSLQNAGRIIRP
ncbi:MAG: sulfurtransferase-like selenium metabolism protein YedF [Deltaproteobacteria bacterium]|nr:MAG: sulfurtransferase-like selenium metabolism protein YedF [Deltaproteobacteria bacterium]